MMYYNEHFICLNEYFGDKQMSRVNTVMVRDFVRHVYHTI